MAIPVSTKNKPKTEKEPSPVESKAPTVVEPTSNVRSIITTLTLANPYTKVTVYPNTLTDHIIVDSWWESQVQAGLAKWQ